MITEQRSTVFCGDKLKSGITTAELVRIDTRGWALVKSDGTTRWVPENLWSRTKSDVIDHLRKQYTNKRELLATEIKTIEQVIDYVESLR